MIFRTGLKNNLERTRRRIQMIKKLTTKVPSIESIFEIHIKKIKQKFNTFGLKKQVNDCISFSVMRAKA
jgi:hypothetical protein